MRYIPKANSKEEVFNIFNKLENSNEKGIKGNLIYFHFILLPENNILYILI